MTVSVQCVKTEVMLTIIAAASCHQLHQAPRMKVANTPIPPMNWRKHPSCPLMSVVAISTT